MRGSWAWKNKNTNTTEVLVATMPLHKVIVTGVRAQGEGTVNATFYDSVTTSPVDADYRSATDGGGAGHSYDADGLFETAIGSGLNVGLSANTMCHIHINYRYAQDGS